MSAGKEMFNSGRNDEAITEFLKALEANEYSAAAYEALGDAYYVDGNYEEALIHYRSAKECLDEHSDQDTSYISVYQGMLNSQWAIGDMESTVLFYIEVCNQYNKLFYIDNCSETVMYEMYDYCISSGDIDMGRELAVTLITYGRDDDYEIGCEFVKDLIDIYNQTGTIQQAVDLRQEAFEITGDEQFDSPEMSIAEAAEKQGLYIVNGADLFCPLDKLVCMSEHVAGIDMATQQAALDYGSGVLACFSSYEISGVYAYPIKQSGYTVPVEFSDTDDSVYLESYYTNNMDEISENAVGDVYRELINAANHGLAGIRSLDRCESINGLTYFEFFDQYAFDGEDFCLYNRLWGCPADICYADLEKGMQITIGFYEGTAYNEITMPANVKYYCYSPCEQPGDWGGEPIRFDAIELPCSLTQYGYAAIDTSSLESGDYIIIVNEVNSILLFQNVFLYQKG